MARVAAGPVLALVLLAACGAKEPARRPAAEDRLNLPRDQQDAQTLGRELFELVDRAIDYRGSHRGRPAASFRQMGIDTLTFTTVRRLVNLDREPVVTVAFRRTDAHEITSCRGDGQILEEATLNGGRFTLMCATASGAQRPVRIADPNGR
jgi:predicted small lipoprotein YifL